MKDCFFETEFHPVQSATTLSSLSNPPNRRNFLKGTAICIGAPIILDGCTGAEIRQFSDTASAFVVAALTSFRDLMGFGKGKSEVAVAEFVNPSQRTSSGLIQTNFYYSPERAQTHLANLRGANGANYFETAFNPVQIKEDKVTIPPSITHNLITRAGSNTPRGTYALQYVTALQKYDPTNSQIYLLEI